MGGLPCTNRLTVCLCSIVSNRRPTLNVAHDSLACLRKGDIAELRSFRSPPNAARSVLEAVCTLKGLQPEWTVAVRMMGDASFLHSLFRFDVKNVPKKRIATYASCMQWDTVYNFQFLSCVY